MNFISTVSTYYASGQVSRREYHHGEDTELKSWYYGDGTNKDGQLEKHFFIDSDGKLEGEIRSWYRNGHVREKCFHKNGERNGEHKTWYENGHPCSQKFYSYECRVGEWKYWKRDGNRDCKNYSVYYGDERCYYFNLRNKLAILRIKRSILSRFFTQIITPYLLFDLLKSF